MSLRWYKVTSDKRQALLLAESKKEAASVFLDLYKKEKVLTVKIQKNGTYKAQTYSA